MTRRWWRARLGAVEAVLCIALVASVAGKPLTALPAAV